MWLHDGGCAGELTTPPGEHARLIDAEDRDEATVASVGGEETVIVAAAFLDGDFVVGTRETRKLDAGAVLVGPEVGRLDHGALVDPTRKQSRDRDRRSFQRPGPVLDPMSHADGRIVPGRAVPDRDNVREVGLTIGSAQHAIAERESAALQPLDVGHTADTHNDDVSRQVASVDQVDARDAIGSSIAEAAMLAGQAGDADAAYQRRAVRGVHSGHDGAQPQTELELEWGCSGLDDSDIEAELAGRGSNLRADEPGADDHYPSAGPKVGTQRDRVVDGADDVYTAHRFAAGPTACAGARRDDHGICLDTGAVRQFDCTRRGVELGGGGTEYPICLQIVVVGLERQVGLSQLSAEELFRQRRAIIRPPDLVADHGEAPGEPLCSKRASSGEPGQRCADDCNVPHYFVPSPRRARISGGRFGFSALSSTRITPSSTTTACVRIGSFAGGASTAPVRRLNRDACSGHSISHPSNQPSASDAS